MMPWYSTYIEDGAHNGKMHRNTEQNKYIQTVHYIFTSS